MSRETDSSSSGPQGRGGAAYPSGTPPYGTGPFPSLHPQEPNRPGDPTSGAAAEGGTPSADEPRTETTLTTRVRINIPGSRPIPPVVVRKPVDGDNGGSAGGDTAAPDLPSGWTVGGAEPRSAAPPGPAQPFPGVAVTVPAPAPAASAVPAETPEKHEKDKSAHNWFSPRKPVTPQAPQGDPFDSPAAAPSGRSGPSQAPAADATQPLSLAGFSDLSPNSPPAPSAPSGFRDGTGGPGGTGEFSPPAVSRENRARPHTPPSGTPYPPGAAAGPFGSPVVSGPRPFLGTGPSSTPGGAPFPSYRPPSPDAPAGPTTGPVTGDMRVPPGSGSHGVPGGSGAPPGTGRQAAPGGDTPVGGVPRADDPTVPPRNVPHQVAPGDKAYRFEENLEEIDEPRAKGRSKLILAGVGLLAAAGVAYGAGLLMDHADVPAGTTVLGVNIGGKSKEDAVTFLDSQFGKRPSDSITLKVGSEQEKLTPSVAGLGVDIDATVGDVAHRDYNPVDVIGSLFGATRAAQPDWIVDNEKLDAQLNSIVSGSSTSGSDGMVKFVDGKAVAVPGKPHETVDVGGSAAKITAAYQQHVATGAADVVTLPVKTVQPKVSQAQLKAAVNGFGKTAMSGLITVRAGGASIPFGPEISLPKFLTMVPAANGDLQPYFDLKVLKQLYGSTFDGVLLERADGSKTAVTPQDVASAMMPALRTTDRSAKTVSLPNVAR